MPLDQTPANGRRINNDYYHGLDDRWYDAVDDPIALLRAESRLRNPWITSEIAARVPGPADQIKVLDLGCGAGYLSNALAVAGHSVWGADLSETSLAVARRHDRTGRVTYVKADAYDLPFEPATFDVVTCTDFLEHVEEPRRVLAQASRVLKPGGLFFFHTFNKNKIAELLVIKSLEWFVKNVPENLHVPELFIRPDDLQDWMRDAGLETLKIRGVRPVFLQKALLRLLIKGEVDPDFRFTWTRSLLVSYTGVARKAAELHAGPVT